MTSVFSTPRRRSDDEMFDSTSDMKLLAAIAAGRVERELRDDTTTMGPHLLGGVAVHLDLNWLSWEGLVAIPASGPPVLSPRAKRLVVEFADLRGESDPQNSPVPPDPN